jgi:hypothetical protein
MATRVWQEDHVDAEVDGVHVLMRLGRREEQQDAVYVGPGVVAVADGMGGHADGAGGVQGRPARRWWQPDSTVKSCVACGRATRGPIGCATTGGWSC